MVVVIILLVLAIVLIAVSLRIVPESSCAVIEFLGSFKVVWQKGLHFKIPLLERIRKYVSLKEQVADFPPQPVITKDNVTMQIDTVVYYKIFDPRLYTYGVENPVNALENLTATTLRNIIGDMELDETLTSRDTINGKMQTILDEATDAWGIKVNRVELKNIIPPREIQEAMEKQMKAEREKRQTLLEAEAHQQSVVARAKGDKEAKILAAEATRDAAIAIATGEAEKIRLVYEAEANGIRKLKEAGTDESVLALKRIEAMKDIANGRATKIFMPTDMTNFATELGTVSELLGTAAATKDNGPLPAEPKAADVCCDDAEKSAVTKEMVRKN
ncbi:MAG: SPFH domain-containing protein [Eubacteriales bacterium]|nr:SPFH domain-containing protein [Eubacteriales bacterium]